MNSIFKNKWQSTKLGEIATEIKNGKNVSQFDDVGKYRVSRIQTISDGTFDLSKTKWTNDEIEESNFLNHGDILVSHINSIEHLGKSALVPAMMLRVVHGINLLRIIADTNKIDNYYLYYFIKSDVFVKQMLMFAKKAVNQASVKMTDIKNFVLPLPPLAEQKQIVALFQVIDTVITQVEEQEKKLKVLRKSLINKLTRKNPKFGNLINMDECNQCFIGDIAEEILDRTNNPSTSGFEKFIGLEDFESGELTVQKHSSPEKLISATKICKKGNVLLARRNTYLKRASLTEFDAICSGDVIVIKADEKIILSKFLVLIMNTNEFWDFAIANASGSMSKRVKWRELVSYSLELPDIKTQKKILAVLEGVEDTRNQLVLQKSNLKKLKQQLLNEILG